MLQNVNEVNQEPAHNELRLVHVTLTKQNCLVTICSFTTKVKKESKNKVKIHQYLSSAVRCCVI